VLLAREGVHDGSLADARRGVTSDDEAGAGVPDQHLPALVTMPERPGAGRERHPVDADARVVREQDLTPDYPGEHRPAAGLDYVTTASRPARSHWYLLGSRPLDLV
jgi:hypothetical protein